MNLIFFTILFFLTAGGFLLGSVPFGLVLTRLFAAADLRRTGSGNIGATNVSRVAGRKLGLLTLLLDVAKGALPVLTAWWVFPAVPDPGWLIVPGLAAFFGHLYPAYTRFRGGGKGVATAAGVFLAGGGVSLGCAFLAFGLVTGISGRVSAGSLAAAVVLPLATALWYASGLMTGLALVVAIFIIIRHRANIQRLRNGSEPRFF